jgi:N6-adenosine-specific RNA methylase IME4
MSAELIFDDIPRGAARTLLVDPPWSFRRFSTAACAKSPDAHYPCMTIDELAALPVADLADKRGAVLLMWTTAPFLPQSLDLMRQWRFRYKTCGAWAKLSRTGSAITFGTGYIYRSAAEFWIVGTIGRPAIRSRSVRNLILESVREHSRKPEKMYEDIETLFQPPYVELFARAARRGWISWGNETAKFAANADLPRAVANLRNQSL